MIEADSAVSDQWLTRWPRVFGAGAEGVLMFFIHHIAAVHGIAGGPSKEELADDYIETSREGFINSMLISVYSFTAVLKEAALLMKGRYAAAITMSYYGSDKVIPHYNVMGVAKAALESSVRYLAADLGTHGIRVNAIISLGTIRTRAASGISDFETLARFTEA